MALIDEFDGGEFDLSQIPGFETLEQQREEEPEEPEEDEEEGEESEEGDDGAKPVKLPKGAVSKKEYETLKSQFDELNGRIKALSEKPAQVVYQQPVPQQQQMSPEQAQALRAQLEQQFYADPIGTNQRIAAAAAQQQFGGVMADMRETLAQQSIQQYRANLMQDPQFAKAAAQHFDQQVAALPRGALATLTPQKLQELLAFAEDAAWGKVMKQVRTNQKKVAGKPVQPTAPGSQNRRPTTPARGLSDHESKLAKALGLTDADFNGIVE
jgi:hypothetical protein